jgi:hypothetical protein
MMLIRNRLAGFLPDVTSKRASDARHRSSVSAKSPLLRSKAGVRGFREVSAYSTVYPELAWGGCLKALLKTSATVSVEMEMSVSDVAMIP